MRRVISKPSFVLPMAATIIYLDIPLLACSSDTTRKISGPLHPFPIRSCSRWGLPYCWCALTAPFHPYRLRGGTHFCGTIPKVTFAGRYPASCPAELGLSSNASTSDCLSYSSSRNLTLIQRRSQYAITPSKHYAAPARPPSCLLFRQWPISWQRNGSLLYIMSRYFPG